MNPILWMVFSACLAYQANADYSINIDKIVSYTDAIVVTNDDPQKGDIKLTNQEERDGSTFKAKLLQGILGELKGEFEGEVCDVDDETAEGTIAKIFHMAVEVDDCPFPEGDLMVTKNLKIEGNVFDQYVSPDSGEFVINAEIYGKDNDGSKYDVLWYIKVTSE